MSVEIAGDVSAYDTIYPTALLRITFQKAHWWHTAEQFADASQDVYDNLGPVAHLSPAQPFPLAGEATTWTVDARNYVERPMSEIVRELSAACDVLGVDYVEPASVQVLNMESVKRSTSTAGAAERAVAASSATSTAAKNVGTAVGDVAAKVPVVVQGIFNNITTILVIVAVILVLFLLVKRGK